METMTVGGAMSGNCAIGRVLIPTTPRKRRMIEMTIANAGRWRIFVNMVRDNHLVFGVEIVGERMLFGVEFLVLEGLFRLTKFVFYLRAFLNLADPFQDDLVTRFDSATDDENVLQFV